MIKKIIKYGFIVAIIYGIYYLASLFPLESVVVGGILLILVIGYWIKQILSG